MFDVKDVSLIKSHGLDEAVVKEQMARFREGFPYLRIVAPATVGYGIVRIDEGRSVALGGNYDKACTVRRIVKFVPASGAATRMFKDLFEFASSGVPNKVSEEVVENIGGFAFYHALERLLPAYASDKAVVEALIGRTGLGYGDKPKAVLLFHRYRNEVRTALEEHLVEGAQYAACGGVVNIHFTVSPEHIHGVQELVSEVLPEYEARFGMSYDITYSVQKSSTDTIAVNGDDTPFRNADGTLLFRPAGHGALLSNLNDIDADIIFLKNIDNVTTDSRRADTVRYKKALAGLLIEVQGRIFGLLERMDCGFCAELTSEAERLVREELLITLPQGYDAMDGAGKAAVLRRILDRPVRVCGMVRNEGEPGGGPFFAENPDGSVSLQVVESSQIAPEKRHLIAEATHFNPVDLVCGVKNYKDVKFDLLRYSDPDTGFISGKSKDGKALKAMELPGLWNGAMSDWNTIFAEVPVSTFTPVKVVTDLLRPEHQN